MTYAVAPPEPVPAVSSDSTPTRLTPEEQEAIVAKWTDLARQTAGTWFRRTPGAEYEDVFQACRLGLVQAAARFDPSRGNQFSTIAYWYVNNEARLYCQEVATGGFHVPNRGFVYIPRVSIDAPSPSGDGSSYAALIPDREGCDAGFGADWWTDALRSLPPRWAEVIRLYFIPQPEGETLTLRGVGARLGVSQERVRQILLKSIEKLRITRPDLADYLPDGRFQ